MINTSQDYADLENQSAEPFWDQKRFVWTRLDVLAGRDRVAYTAPDSLLAGRFDPTTANVFTYSVKGSINYFAQHAGQPSSFLMSLWAAVSHKHSFSEVFEANDFQQQVPVNDSIRQLGDTKSVFVNSDAFSKRIVLDFGIRAVQMVGLGADRRAGPLAEFRSKRIGLRPNLPFLVYHLGGSCYTLSNAAGLSVFNLEVFYQSDIYSHFSPQQNDRFLGFSVSMFSYYANKLPLIVNLNNTKAPLLAYVGCL